MANRESFIDHDRHGRERFVIRTTSRRSSSRTRPSTRELLLAAEDRIMALEDGTVALEDLNQQLQNQFARAQANERRAKEECEQLLARLQGQAEATRRVQDKLEEEKSRSNALEQRLRLMRRTSHDETYRQRYEDALARVESRDEQLRLNEMRLESKTAIIVEQKQVIQELKEHLRRLGYRVVNG